MMKIKNAPASSKFKAKLMQYWIIFLSCFSLANIFYAVVEGSTIAEEYIDENAPKVYSKLDGLNELDTFCNNKQSSKLKISSPLTSKTAEEVRSICKNFFLSDVNSVKDALLAGINKNAICSPGNDSLPSLDLAHESSIGIPADIEITVDQEEYELWLAYKALPDSPLNKEAYKKWKYILTYRDFKGSTPHAAPTSLGIIPPSFLASYLRPSSSQQEFDSKMGQFYQEEKMHRGYPETRTISDLEMVAFFFNTSEMTAGKGLDKAPKEDAATERQYYIDAMERYNRRLVTDLERQNEIFNAHIRGSSADYDNSGLSSFSTNKSRAQYFASTGWRTNTGDIQSEIVFSARKAKFGPYEDFRDTYGKLAPGITFEMEILFPGNVDPESLKYVTIQGKQTDRMSPAKLRIGVRTSFNTVSIFEQIIGDDGRIRVTEKKFRHSTLPAARPERKEESIVSVGEVAVYDSQNVETITPFKQRMRNLRADDALFVLTGDSDQSPPYPRTDSPPLYPQIDITSIELSPYEKFKLLPADLLPAIPDVFKTKGFGRPNINEMIKYLEKKSLESEGANR